MHGSVIGMKALFRALFIIVLYSDHRMMLYSVSLAHWYSIQCLILCLPCHIVIMSGKM